MGKTRANNTLPEFLKKYFWDCDFENISLREYPFFIIERILNFGNSDAIRWLMSNVDEESIRKIVKSSRNLNKKTKNYWEIMFK